MHELEEMGAGRVQTWPRWVRENLLKQGTLSVHSRFATTLFLLGNGVLPRAIAAYLLGAGLLADRRAQAHIWDIMRDFRDGALRVDAQYWGVREGGHVTVSESMWAHGAPLYHSFPQYFFHLCCHISTFFSSSGDKQINSLSQIVTFPLLFLLQVTNK